MRLNREVAHEKGLKLYVFWDNQNSASQGQESITFQRQTQPIDATGHPLRTHTPPEGLGEEVCSPRRSEGRTAVRNKGTSLVATILSPQHS